MIKFICNSNKKVLGIEINGLSFSYETPEDFYYAWPGLKMMLEIHYGVVFK